MTNKQNGKNPRPQNNNLRKGGPGRKKGVPNKLSGLAKDNIAAVFDKLGGIENMVMWAQGNTTEFYKLYARLIPVQVEGEGGGPLVIKIIQGLGDEAS